MSLALVGLPRHFPPRSTWLKQGSFPLADSVVRAFHGTISPSDASQGLEPDFAFTGFYRPSHARWTRDPARSPVLP